MNYKIFIEGKNFDRGDGELPINKGVTTKIKSVDPDEANSEIEKGEIVLDPETGALHKALGKLHSQGGTLVSLKDNSFIFSNYKDLSISKKQKELFEFKLGGKKAINNTPAKVLGREVDLEHHNKMIDILQNDKKYDAGTINSAKLMMLKNLEKAGQIAFIQESKKGYQTPDFAQDTAPIYSKDTDQKITQSMQYLQSGGGFNDLFNYQPPKKKEITYFPLSSVNSNVKIKLQDGQLYTPKELKDLFDWSDKDISSALGSGTAREVMANSKPTSSSRKDASTGQPPYPETWINYKDKTNKQSYTAPSWISPKDFYAVPGLVDYMKTLNNQSGIDNDMGKADDSHWGWRHQAALAKFFPSGPLEFKRLPPSQVEKIPPVTPVRGVVNIPPNKMVGNKPGDVDGITDRTNYNTKLTPWQRINMAIPFYRAATVKTQYPIRQHQESLIPQLQNQNVQPILDSNNQGYFNAAALTSVMNPTQASSYLQQLYGNRLNANAQAFGQIQNQNIQTQNRQAELTAQSLNQDANANRAFDSRFYDQTQVAIKNSRDLREAYEQQGIQGINDTMSKKLAFDSWLNTQQQYRGRKTYIDKDGIQHYEGVAPYTPKANFFGYSIQNNPTNIDWSTYQKSQGTLDTPEELGSSYQKLLQYMPGLTPDAFMKSRALKGYITNPNNDIPSSSFYKFGGKYRKIKK